MSDASIGVPRADGADAGHTQDDQPPAVDRAVAADRGDVTVWLPQGSDWEAVDVPAGETLAVELPDGSYAAIVEVHDDATADGDGET